MTLATLYLEGLRRRAQATPRGALRRRRRARVPRKGSGTEALEMQVLGAAEAGAAASTASGGTVAISASSSDISQSSFRRMRVARGLRILN